MAASSDIDGGLTVRRVTVAGQPSLPMLRSTRLRIQEDCRNLDHDLIHLGGSAMPAILIVLLTSLALLLPAAPAVGSDGFQLAGFAADKGRKRSKSRKADDPLLIAVFASDGQNGCVRRGGVSIESLKKYIGQTELVGLFLRCGLVGFHFPGNKQLWFQIDDVVIEPAEAWTAHLAAQAPDLNCSRTAITEATPNTGTNSHHVRAFCD